MWLQRDGAEASLLEAEGGAPWGQRSTSKDERYKNAEWMPQSKRGKFLTECF